MIAKFIFPPNFSQLGSRRKRKCSTIIFSFTIPRNFFTSVGLSDNSESGGLLPCWHFETCANSFKQSRVCRRHVWSVWKLKQYWLQVITTVEALAVCFVCFRAFVGVRRHEIVGAFCVGVTTASRNLFIFMNEKYFLSLCSECVTSWSCAYKSLTMWFIDFSNYHLNSGTNAIALLFSVLMSNEVRGGRKFFARYRFWEPEWSLAVQQYWNVS